MFATAESTFPEPSIYTATDGKRVGTYIEKKFKAYLDTKYFFPPGSSGKGIDFPGLDVDIKVTSIRQPQSSCPYKSARQKIFGLGYSLLVFVYTKVNNDETKTSTLNFNHVIFIEKEHTADYQMTTLLQQMLDNDANDEDIVSFLFERHLMIDEIEANKIAKKLLATRTLQTGYLTITPAPQWRLNYKRAIQKAGDVEGVIRLI